MSFIPHTHSFAASEYLVSDIRQHAGHSLLPFDQEPKVVGGIPSTALEGVPSLEGDRAPSGLLALRSRLADAQALAASASAAVRDRVWPCLAETDTDMPETGISPAEVGREIGHHADQRRERDRAEERRDRQLLIVEAILLSVVALLAGWSGYAAAKWNTDSSLVLARESTLRIEASRANLQALDIRNFDASTFNTWFSPSSPMTAKR